MAAETPHHDAQSVPAREFPMIDVLIPAFNVEETIRGSIASILNQSFRDFRVVIVDDGSTDRTPQILQELMDADPRVVAVRKENSGIVDSLNFGLTYCRAEFVARHDGDDIAYPERFATQIDYLRAHPDCVAVGVNAWHIDGKGRPTGGHTHMVGDVTGDATSVPSAEPYIMHPFLMVRRAALEAVGGYRHVLHSEDTDLYWRIREIGRLHNIGLIMGEYRMHTGAVSSRSTQNARICAAMSQLAAISAERRAAGKADMIFPSLRERYQAATDFREVLGIAAQGLEPAEAAYLELAAAAKLIDIRTFRKIKLSANDVRTVTSILWAGRSRLSRHDKRWLFRKIKYLLRPKFGIKAMMARRRGTSSAIDVPRSPGKADHV